MGERMSGRSFVKTCGAVGFACLVGLGIRRTLQERGEKEQ